MCGVSFFSRHSLRKLLGTYGLGGKLCNTIQFMNKIYEDKKWLSIVIGEVLETSSIGTRYE